MSKRIAGILIIALIAWAATTLGFHYLLNASHSRMLWDYYPLWRAGRWLLEGNDPYSDALTDQIQLESYGHLVQDQDPHTFAYPMPALILVLPLSLLPASVAQPIWLSCLLWGWVWSVVGFSHTLNPSARPSTRAAVVIWSLLLHPTAWGMLLGQPAIAATALLMAALVALRSEREALAGVALAAAAIKPQISLLATLALLIWAAWQHRYRLIVWFAGTAVLLLAVSLALIPGWAAGFLYAVRRYADLMPFRSPIAVLASLCGESGAWLQAALTAGFIILTGWSWKKDIRTGVVPIGAVGVSLVTTTLAVPRLSPINHIVLLVPLAAGLSEWWRRKGLCRLASTVLGVLAVAAPWAIAPLTGNAVEGDSWQYGVLVFVLPVLSLVVSTAESVKPARSRCRVGAGGKGGGSEK